MSVRILLRTDWRYDGVLARPTTTPKTPSRDEKTHSVESSGGPKTDFRGPPLGFQGHGMFLGHE
jgi:hypothetical protein